MKKIIMLLCVVASFLFFDGIQTSYAVLKQAPPVSAVKPEAIAKQPPPDLAVSVKFVHIETWARDDGTKCYSPRPEFTITNRGQSDADNFDYIIEWKLGPGHTWQIYTSSNPTISLKAGAKHTINGNNGAWEQPWCTNQNDWRPGWRISVDTKNTVAESNETNNVAEKMFESYMIKPEVPKAIPKEIPKAPIQKRAPMQMR